jgi:uncharacterized protein YgbK (DUF1537 family)
MFSQQVSVSDKAPAQDLRRPPPLLVVADDLTGACDAAVAFTSITRDVRVHLGINDLTATGFRAVSTNTRDSPLSAVQSSLLSVSAHLPPDSEVFKKIDSAFRGNTIAEIAASVRAFPADLVVLAPAYPALGRIVHHGALHIHLHIQAPKPSTRPIAAELKEHGCDTITVSSDTSAESLAKQMQRALQQPRTLVLCDASTQAHLEAVVRAAHSLRVRTLWIGSGGLAHALAKQWPPLTPQAGPPLTPGDTLFFIGSDHPVTRGQITHLRRMSGIAATVCTTASTTSGNRIFQLARGDSIEDLQRATTPLQPADVACLFMTGGDTASLVCNALGITSLQLLAEFAPGVPLARAEGGRFHGVPVILKSGGFGERTLLCRILDTFAATGTAASS